jgi:hypothetical protein
MKTIYFSLICLLSSSYLKGQIFEIESNNSFSIADNITSGSLVKGKINEAGDLDYFKLSTNEGGSISFKALSLPGNIGLEMRLYDSNFNEFAYFKGSEGQGYIVDASNCGSGTIYLLIQDNGNAFNPDEYYEFQLNFSPFSQLDPLECNNNFSSAAWINTNQAYEAYLLGPFDNSPHQKDIDIYRFDVAEPGMFLLKVRNVVAPMELDAWIFLPDQQTIVASQTNAGDGNGYDLTFSLATTGTHYIWIEEDYRAYHPDAPYSFQLDFIPFQGNDNWEPNNIYTDAPVIPFGDTICAHIGPAYDDAPYLADIDIYKLDIREPGIINFSLFEVPANLEIQSWIISPDQQTNLTWETNPGVGAGYSLSLSIAEPGNYYLWMGEDGRASNMDLPYCFSMDFIPFSTVDPCEVNNSYSNACLIEPTDTISALINPWFRRGSSYYDVDIYKLEIPEAGYFWFEAMNVPGNYELEMWCMMPDQQTVLFNETNGGQGSGYFASDRICQPGTYYLYLQGTSWNLNEPYRFTTHYLPVSESDPQESNEDFSSAFALDLCDTIQASIFNFCEDNQEDFDFFKVEMAEGEILPINVLSSMNEFKLCMEIYSPDGTLLERVTPTTAGSTFSGTIRAEETGDYYLKFSDCNRGGETLTGYSFAVGCSKLSGIKEREVEDFAKVYPNPFSDNFTIEVNQPAGKEYVIELFDLRGQLVLKQESSPSNIEIPDSFLPDGNYLLKISSSGFYQLQILSKQ